MAKVVILCGGRGTRLKEHTDFIPKPMINIGTRPILWHIMKIYSHYGFNEFVLALGYKSEVIKNYFINYHLMNSDITINTSKMDVKIHCNKKNCEDWTVHLVETGLDSETAKRVYLLKDFISKDDFFMLTYGDGVGNINIKNLLEFHKKKGVFATITGYKPIQRFGVLKHKNGIVTKFDEKPEMLDLVNCGFMVFNRDALKYFDGSNIMLEQVLPKIVKDRQLAVYNHEGFWHPMDTQRDYEELNKIWINNPPWKVWND